MTGLARAMFCGLLSFAVVMPALAQATKAKASAAKVPVIAAAGAVAKGNAVVGKSKADEERCVECHGHDGHANDIEDGIGNIGKFPRLAGQHVEYIVKQFSEFRSGKRNNETMSVMAKSVSNADLLDIAAYFSSQKPMQGDGSGDNPIGKNLFLNGDAARGILACAGCHTDRVKGAADVSPENPVIAGQHRRYLQKQLLEWRAGERRNSPGDVMNKLTKGLTDKEIDALADYVSGL